MRTMDELAARQDSLAVAEVATEHDDEEDEDGDVAIKVEETEAEIDGWLVGLAEEMEEQEEMATDLTK